MGRQRAEPAIPVNNCRNFGLVINFRPECGVQERVLAPILLKTKAAQAPRLSSSVKSKDTRRRQVVMREVKRVLMLILMGLVLSLGAVGPTTAFGQKNDNRPPKEPDKVKERDKQPRGNSNSQGNSNRHGRN